MIGGVSAGYGSLAGGHRRYTAQPRQDTGTVRVWGEVRTVRGVVVVSGLHVPGLPRLAADYARTDVEILRDATLIYGNAGHR